MVNDVVDELAPVIYALIRSGAVNQLEAKISLNTKAKALKAQNDGLIQLYVGVIGRRLLLTLRRVSTSRAILRMRHPSAFTTQLVNT